MLIRPISDLHTELWSENQCKAHRRVDLLIPPLPDDATTILLLAGDTGSLRRRTIYKAVVEHLCDRFQHVVDLPGNHFWYGTPFEQIEAVSDRPNYLFGQTFAQHGIVGATLWADFQRGNPLVEEACRSGMNDFRQIPGLTTEAVKARHRDHVAFLAANIRPGSVVVTHFAPSWQSIPPHFKLDICNGYYASDLDDLIRTTNPALWLHGHIHAACDYKIGGTSVMCNPAGYDGRDHDRKRVVRL